MSRDSLYRDCNLQIILAITLIGVMGTTSIAPAFPQIVEALNISKTQVGLIIVAFTLPSVFLAPPFGLLADRFGRKRVLIPALLLFGIAGSACALSRSFSLLIFLRVLSGVGSAGLTSVNLTVLGDLFTGERRTAAMGLNGTVLSAGAAGYPLLGGILATFGWYYPFLLCLAALPVAILAWRSLHCPPAEKSGGLGQYLSGAWHYIRRLRTISAFLGGTTGFILLYGAIFTYLTLYLDSAFQASPVLIGVITASLSVATAVASALLGRLSRNLSLADIVKIGFIFCAVGLGPIPFVPHLGFMFVFPLLFGAGFGFIFPCVQTYIAGVAPSQYRAALMALNSTMFRLGHTLGPLVVGLAYTWGDFKGAFLFSAGLALAAATVGFIGGKIMGPVTSPASTTIPRPS